MSRLKAGDLRARGRIELHPPRLFADNHTSDELTAEFWDGARLYPEQSKAIRHADDYDPRKLGENDFRWRIHDIIIFRTDALNKFELLQQKQPTTGGQDPPTAKKVGGRPPIYDWVRCAAYLAAYIDENSYPADRAVIERVVRNWFKTKGAKGRAPEESSIYDFVKALYDERDALIDARKKDRPR